jgi:arylsulfatase A-like enzyme
MSSASSTTRRAFFGASALAIANAAQQQPPRRRPNILLILADDLGYNDLGFQGARDIPTPHLDALARGGTRFTSGYVSHPFCSPTRAGLMTGRYQHRFGHENNMVFNYRDEIAGLPLSEVTLADVLGSSGGYATGLVGKWHLGAHERFHPMKRGFKEMFGFVSGGHDYFNVTRSSTESDEPVPVQRNGQAVPESDEYLTTALGREAAAFIRRHRSEPFFLYLAFNAPHTPLQAPREYEDRVAAIPDRKRRTYAAMVAAMDDAVGEAIQALRESGLEQDTLVFFMSDNGGPAGGFTDNAPLRGHKRSVYEGGIRVPFVMRWPGRVPEGRVDPRIVSSLDVFPTSLAAAGIAAPSRRPIDGINLLPYLTPDNTTRAIHRQLCWRVFGDADFAVREDNLKLVRTQGNAPELYDLDKDPGEKNNLAAAEPRAVMRLEQTLREWQRVTRRPLWDDHIFHRKRVLAGGGGA